MTNDNRERDEAGRFVEKYNARDFLRPFTGEELTTNEVADEMDVPYQTAYYFLRRLEDRGALQSRKRSDVKFWSVTEDGNAE